MTIITDRERLLALPVYPQMIASESRVLRQFIRARGAAFDEFRFNVRIGEGERPGEEFDPAVRKAWESITKARPDTVAFTHPDQATIIEVKDALTNEGVWQVLGYRDLYARAFPEHRIRLACVAAYASPTARELARRQGVDLYLYALPPGPPDVAEEASEEL